MFLEDKIENNYSCLYRVYNKYNLLDYRIFYSQTSSKNINGSFTANNRRNSSASEKNINKFNYNKNNSRNNNKHFKK